MWPRLQLMVSEPIPFRESATSAANTELSNFFAEFGIENAPLIFMDEFNVCSTSTPLERARFAFFRNLLCVCGLIPVIMGTNPHLTNMITSAVGSGSENGVWSHIFYKMPSYPSSILEHRLTGSLPIINRFEN